VYITLVNTELVQLLLNALVPTMGSLCAVVQEFLQHTRPQFKVLLHSSVFDNFIEAHVRLSAITAITADMHLGTVSA